MNFEALPCVIKNADGVPTYGLLIRPLQQLQSQNQSLDDSVLGRESIEVGVGEKAPNTAQRQPPTPVELTSDGVSASGVGSAADFVDDDVEEQQPVSRFSTPFFLPAASLHHDRQINRRGDPCPQNSNRLASSFHPFVCGGPPKHQPQHQTSVSSRGAGDYSFLDDLESTDISSFLQELSCDPSDLVQLDSASLNASQLELMDSVPSASFAERLIQHSSTPSRFSCRFQRAPTPPPTRPCAAVAPATAAVLPPHPPPRTPGQVTAVAAVALYPDAATPDSGIQSIGESPRSPPCRLTQPLSICCGGMGGVSSGDVDWAADNSPPLTRSTNNATATVAATTAAGWSTATAADGGDFGDMPTLERQVAVEAAAAADVTAPVDAAGDPKTLIDRVLSSLAPDQLASMSELLHAKLSSMSSKTWPTVAKDDEVNVQTPRSDVDSTPAMDASSVARKLSDYRAKMKQKRQAQRIAYEIDSLCRRLERLSGSSPAAADGDDHTTAAATTKSHLCPIDWSSIERRSVTDAAVVATSAVDTCGNLEREASDDDNSGGAAAEAIERRRDSLKVKIRLLRRQRESLTLHDDDNDNDAGAAKTTAAERLSGVTTAGLCNASLPLKKRFTCQSASKASSTSTTTESSLQLDVDAEASIANAKRRFAVQQSRGLSPSTAALRRRSKRTRCTSDDCCDAPPPPSDRQESSAPPRVNPGLLRKCRSCGGWLKVARGTPHAADQLRFMCRKCRRSRMQSARLPPPATRRLEGTQSPLFSIRLLSPKKKFVKCGLHYSADGRSPSTVTSPWPRLPPLHAQHGQPFFQLPYDLWWHGVYQKKFLCKDPSINYRRIRNNVYVDAKVSAAVPCQPCNCKVTRSPEGREVCGDTCLNRMMLTECTSGVCPCGDLCSNRRFQKRRWAAGLEKFWTGAGKGFGVRATKPIKAGSFVCEYLGELVSPDTLEERMRTWYRTCSRHFALTLDSGAVIDGYRCGSVARFINHSCQPNCHVQKWLVNGHFRVGIFASQNIDPGRELTYDYNFRSFGESTVEKCLCLADLCTGTVGMAKNSRPADCATRGSGEETAPNLSPEAESLLARRRFVWLPRNLRPRRAPRSKRRRKGVDKQELSGRIAALLRVIVERFKSADSIDVNLSRLCCQMRPLLGNRAAVLSSLPGADVRKLLKLTLSCASLSWAEHAAAEALSKLLPSDANVAAAADAPPLVGDYDPDDGVALWNRGVTADALPPGDVDKVRCVCGIFEEDGTMVQCDGCLFWLHGDCLSPSSIVDGDDSAPFRCEFCCAADGVPLRSVLRDVPLTPPPDFRLAGCAYYRALLSSRSLHIRIGDCVYVKRNIDERHRRLLAALGGDPSCADGKPSSCVQELLEGGRRAYARDQLRIMRVERLFVSPGGIRFVFGNYFAHHYETFCEPSRRFYENEVFVTPLYDTWPVEAVVGRCLVLDPSTFCAGRPTLWRFDPADLYVCEYRVDKAQRLFDKSSAAKFRHSLNTNSHFFRRFQHKLKISRTFTPFGDQVKKKSSDEDSAHFFNLDALSDHDVRAFTALYKKAKLLKLVKSLPLTSSL